MAGIRARPPGTYWPAPLSKRHSPVPIWPASTASRAHSFKTSTGESMSDVQQRIHATVTGNPVVLYMKGDARFPQCGFSATAVQILKVCGVKDFVTVNVLADEEIRNGVKEYA